MEQPRTRRAAAAAATTTLGQAEAEAIALGWMARTVDAGRDYLFFSTIAASLLPELEVDVEGQRDNFEISKQALATLRETLGVWRALACCRGFGGFENPRMWNKVVRESVLAADDAEFVESEHIAFHDEAASPSRVILKFAPHGVINRDGRNKQRVRDWMRAVCLELFEMSDSGVRVPLSDEYRTTLQRLQPFIDKQRFAREVIVVELSLYSHRLGKKGNADPEMLRTYAAILNEIATRSVAGGSDAPAEAPVLSLRYTSFPSMEIKSKRGLETFTSLLTANPLPISHMCPMFDKNDMEPVAFSEFVTTILQTKELSARMRRRYQATAPGKLRSILFFLSSPNRLKFASIFSALPHAQSLRILRLTEFGLPKSTWTEYEVCWLAYACFHPRSKTSSWRELWLESATMTSEAREMLASFQHNPSAALSITRIAVATGVVPIAEARSDRLQIATVKKGAKIYVVPSTCGINVITLGVEAELEMCDLHSQDWHCVLVPGYNLGWVQAANVKGMRDWIVEEPPTSSLTALDPGGSFELEDALLLLSVFGASIENLAFGNNGSSGHILDKLTAMCPNLKELDVDGPEREPLSQHSLMCFFSRASGALESFTVSWVICNPPVLLKILTDWTHKEPVKRLQKLYLRGITEHSFGSVEIALLEAMLQANQSLEQLYLIPADTEIGWDIRTACARLEEHSGEDIYYARHVKQRVAFLSVVARHHEAQQSVLAQLSSTMVSTIFEFAASHVRRIIYPGPTKVDY